MDDSHDEKACSSFSSYRSPNFRRSEVKALVELIEKYKNPLLIKSTNTTANHAKEKAWDKVTKEFNILGLGPKRTEDVLKTKWINLKRSARKLGNNLMVDEFNFHQDEIIRAVELMNIEIEQCDFDDENNVGNEKEEIKPWASDGESSVHSIDDENENNTTNKNSHRSPNFHATEVKALVELIEKYKNPILNKCIKAPTNYVKDKAWEKVTKEFNSRGLGHVRTVDGLRMKWENLKRTARKLAKDDKVDEYNFHRDDIIKVVTLLNTSENEQCDFDDENYVGGGKEELKLWECDDDRSSVHSIDDENENSTANKNSHRSPNFHIAEIRALVELIDKYKSPILNKCIKTTAIYAKDKAWEKVTKELNSRGLGHVRTVDGLRMKWENLKRTARKFARDEKVDEYNFHRDDIIKVVTLLNTSENERECDVDAQKDQNGLAVENEEFKQWSLGDDRSFIDDENEKSTPNKKSPRCDTPPGFSPRDCRLLLKCVRDEKCVLFSKSSVGKRHQAWKRIADSFNKQSARMKSSKELSKKFASMKAMAKKINFKGCFIDLKKKKYEQLNDSIDQKIKPEPIQECIDIDFDNDSMDNIRPAEVNHSADYSRLSFTHDPLSNVHNSDSGLGSVSDKKDVVKLKLDLLNYKMETARLKRKHIEDAIATEKTEREMRALEQSMRLRAARLELLAAEMKLRPSHPELMYTAEERRAQQYMSNSKLDIG